MSDPDPKAGYFKIHILLRGGGAGSLAAVASINPNDTANSISKTHLIVECTSRSEKVRWVRLLSSTALRSYLCRSDVTNQSLADSLAFSFVRFISYEDIF